MTRSRLAGWIALLTAIAGLVGALVKIIPSSGGMNQNVSGSNIGGAAQIGTVVGSATFNFNQPSRGQAGFGAPAPTAKGDAYLMMRTVEAQRRSIAQEAVQHNLPIDPVERQRAEDEYTEGVQDFNEGKYDAADELLNMAKADYFDLETKLTQDLQQSLTQSR